MFITARVLSLLLNFWIWHSLPVSRQPSAAFFFEWNMNTILKMQKQVGSGCRGMPFRQYLNPILSLKHHQKLAAFPFQLFFPRFIRLVLFIFPGQSFPRLFSLLASSLSHEMCLLFHPDIWIICCIFLHFHIHRRDWIEEQNEHRRISFLRDTGCPPPPCSPGAHGQKRGQVIGGSYLWGGISWRPPPCRRAAGGSWGPGPGPKRTLPGRRHDDPGTAVQPPDESRPALKQEKKEIYLSKWLIMHFITGIVQLFIHFRHANTLIRAGTTPKRIILFVQEPARVKLNIHSTIPCLQLFSLNQLWIE